MSFFCRFRAAVHIITISLVLLLAVSTVAVGVEAGDVGLLIESNVTGNFVLALALHPSDDVSIRPELWAFFSSDEVDYEQEDGETVVDYDFRIGTGIGVYFNVYDEDGLTVFVGPHATYIFTYDEGINSLDVNGRSNFTSIAHTISAGPRLGATYMFDERVGVTANIKIDASLRITGVNYESIQQSDYLYTNFEIHTIRGNIGLLFYPQ